jgi:prophage regulatory protein
MSERFLRMRDVVRATGLGRSTIYRLVKDGMFPRPVPLLGPHATAWLESEIDDWQQARVRERDAEITSTAAAAG